MNTNEGTVIMPIPPMPFSDILYLDREGIGIRLENMFGTGSIEARLFTYQRLAAKNGGIIPVRFFPISVINSAGTYTRKYNIMGASASVVDVYSFLFKGVDARYTPSPGDSHADLAAGMRDAINAATFPDPYEITASSSGTILTLVINSGQLPEFLSIYNDYYRYEYGYFVKMSVLGQENDYHLIGAYDNINYQSFPTLTPPYSFNDIDIATNGIAEYLKSEGFPDYTITRNQFFNEVGTIEISDVPYVVTNSSRAVHDEQNSRIIFSNQSPLKANENLTLLYR